MASLLAQNVSKTYVRVPVLQDVTLSVGQASVHCLAGENGSGKSTLIKIISGTLSADTGKVIIDGHDATHENALKRIELGLSVIYQDFSLLPNLSVFENITFLRQRIPAPQVREFPAPKAARARDVDPNERRGAVWFKSKIYPSRISNWLRSPGLCGIAQRLSSWTNLPPRSPGERLRRFLESSAQSASKGSALFLLPTNWRRSMRSVTR